MILNLFSSVFKATVLRTHSCHGVEAQVARYWLCWGISSGLTIFTVYLTRTDKQTSGQSYSTSVDTRWALGWAGLGTLFVFIRSWAGLGWLGWAGLGPSINLVSLASFQPTTTITYI